MKEHEKIINKIAKIVLEPEGIFRVGSSRIRIDDNGWFFIVIEFQPSNYSKETYLCTSSRSVQYWKCCMG